MKKLKPCSILRCAAALCAIIIGASASKPCLAEETPKLRLGALLCLSGEGASIGTAVQNGMRLALENLPPEMQQRVEVFFEDDQMNPKHTLSAYNRLRKEKNINAVLSLSSGTSKALAPLADQHGLPVLAIATDPKVAEGRRYVMNFWVTAEEQVRKALPEVQRRGYKKIARISTILDFPLSLKQQFDSRNRDQVQVILDEEYPLDIKDFRTYLAKLKARRDADAVLANLMTGQLGVFAKQLRQAGITLPVFGFEVMEDSNEVAVSEGALLGQWYVNTDDPDQAFITRYKARFPGASLYGASNGHDALLVFAAAAEKSPHPDAINSFIHTLKDFHGALGVYSASSSGNHFTLPAAVKVVTGTGFEKLH